MNVSIAIDDIGITEVIVRQKEARTLKFTVTDQNAAAVDLSGATFKFNIESETAAESFLVEKISSDFGTARATGGIVTVGLSPTNMNLNPGVYNSEFEVNYSASHIEKRLIAFKVQNAVIV